jgi:alcohol dehydrogenase, propanol-preferring
MIGMPVSAFLRAPVFKTILEITIKGSYVGNRRDTAEALEFFQEGVIDAPFKVVWMSKLQEVYDMMEKGEIVGRYVVDTSR